MYIIKKIKIDNEDDMMDIREYLRGMYLTSKFGCCGPLMSMSFIEFDTKVKALDIPNNAKFEAHLSQGLKLEYREGFVFVLRSGFTDRREQSVDLGKRKYVE